MWIGKWFCPLCSRSQVRSSKGPNLWSCDDQKEYSPEDQHFLSTLSKDSNLLCPNCLIQGINSKPLSYKCPTHQVQWPTISAIIPYSHILIKFNFIIHVWMLCSETCYVSMVVDILWPAKCWSVLCITKWVCKFFIWWALMPPPVLVLPHETQSFTIRCILGILSIT